MSEADKVDETEEVAVEEEAELRAATARLIRRVPVVGTIFGVVAMPTFAAACTYALGRVFAWHFAKGGTVADFDADEASEKFKDEFAEGKRKASEFVKGGSKTTAKPASNASTAKA
mgnify:CR=1 FL=1